jgi:hypothetical protein
MAFYHKPPRLREGDSNIFVGRSGPNENKNKENVVQNEFKESIFSEEEKQSVKTPVVVSERDRKEISRVLEKRIFQTLFKKELEKADFNKLSNEEFQKLLYLLKLRKKIYHARFKCSKKQGFSRTTSSTKPLKSKRKVSKGKVATQSYFRKLVGVLIFWEFYGKPAIYCTLSISLIFLLITGHIFLVFPSLKYLSYSPID